MFYLPTTALHNIHTAIFQDFLSDVSKSRQKKLSLDLIVGYQEECQSNTQLVMCLQDLLGPKSALCNIQKSTFGYRAPSLSEEMNRKQEPGFSQTTLLTVLLDGKLQF